MIQELILFQHMEMNLIPTLAKVFLHLVRKQINVLHGKLHLIKFTTIKLKNKSFIKILG